MNENEEATELLKSLLSAVNDLSKSATTAMAVMIEGKAPLNTSIIRLVKFKHLHLCNPCLARLYFKHGKVCAILLQIYWYWDSEE